MENKILGYVDGRLKEGERLEMEKHLSTCAACQLRVNEFRSVHALLDELPMIEPSAAFDIRLHARVAAEPAKQSWWAWFMPAPRVAFVAAMLLVATVWIGRETNSISPFGNPQEADLQMMQDMPVLEDHDVISNFEPLKDLPQPVQADEGQSNQTM